ncbi:MAG: acylneuraminate cytidylyltransferase family protein [Chloroflexi bacterium]|nr:acylneuraminate cytidylyltransferase family protein [Chloroflexota bacterium]
MEIVAIIPARGGSKSIPRKNIQLLGGKPLIAHSIEKALKCPLINRVAVSTDDEEIAQIARKFGAEVPFIRPRELALDTTPMIPVLQHAVSTLEKTWSTRIDIVVLLSPPAPFREVSDIELCINKLIAEEADSVITVCEAEHNPYFQMVKFAGDRLVRLMKTRNPITRRQDAPKVYRLNDSIYAIKRDVLMEKGKILTENTRGVIMPMERSLDIDHPLDFEFADFLLRKTQA